jgi:hypothetical protein
MLCLLPVSFSYTHSLGLHHHALCPGDIFLLSGSYLTHEASGLDEQGEAREAFLNGGDGHKRKEEFFI